MTSSFVRMNSDTMWDDVPPSKCADSQEYLRLLQRIIELITVRCSIFRSLSKDSHLPFLSLRLYSHSKRVQRADDPSGRRENPSRFGNRFSGQLRSIAPPTPENQSPILIRQRNPGWKKRRIHSPKPLPGRKVSCLGLYAGGISHYSTIGSLMEYCRYTGDEQH